MVIVGHFAPQNNQNYEIGRQGVAIFFVLSGYLITTNLVREQESTGSIDLRAFYVRRFFRLMPCAWAMLSIMLLMRIIDFRELASCVFFYRNFLTRPRTGITGHFWSLSIEEQFYLAWPWVIALLRRQRARWVSIALACGFAMFRFFAFESIFPTNGLWTPFWADALLVGCFFALTPQVPKLPAWAFAVATVIVSACVHFFTGIPPVGEYFLIGWMIHTTAMGGIPAAQRILNWSFIARVGMMSYALYVWQTPVSGIPHSTPISMALTLFSLMVVTVGSFYLIETPSRRLGVRIASRRGTSTACGTTSRSTTTT
jgi:peptidoglycan/LPS O-acetylase OafA/YrhL